MLINQRKQWDIYTASKEAQCVNIVPKKQIVEGWDLHELIAMFVGFMSGVLIVIIALGLIPLAIVMYNWV